MDTPRMSTRAYTLEVYGHTFGVWPLTFPARAREPCTLPAGRKADEKTGII